jgi:cytochrome c oxidase subunit 3
MSTNETYYVPPKATWPVLVVAGLTLFLAGFANLINHSALGKPMMVLGAATFIVMVAGWFSLQALESEGGMYNAQVGTSYRMGMMWFIFSEVMFFAAFFGALFYTRVLAVPWLGGEGGGPGASTNLLWHGFKAVWPTSGPGERYSLGEPMPAWGLPAVNTLILLSSGATVTWAHWGLIANNRKQLIRGLIATVTLGFLFVTFQAYEYHEAYSEMGMTLGSGIYGTTFFMLTGFHGLHVTLGAIILSVVLFRSILGHFSKENHFVFEAAAWYWHFVDVVWLLLFVFVYWL